jgi:hypothetical protein
VEESFSKHLDVIKVAFCHPKKSDNSDVWVPEVLSATSFDIQQSLFKLAMKSNACVAMAKSLDVNPLTHLWQTFLTSEVFTYSFPKYFKLVEIAMVQVHSNVEDEQCFNSLAFYKSKLRNQLTTNLGLVVKMSSQKFYTLHDFPCAKAYE